MLPDMLELLCTVPRACVPHPYITKRVVATPGEEGKCKLNAPRDYVLGNVVPSATWWHVQQVWPMPDTAHVDIHQKS